MREKDMNNPNVKYMECDLCHKKLHPLDAHSGKLREKFTTAHIDCWNKAIEIVKDEEILDSNEACDKQPNCKECVKAYGSDFDNNDFVPCNFIRKKYGVSIWDYKESKVEQ